MDYNDYDSGEDRRARELRKRKWKRNIRIKKFLAAFTLFLIAAAIITAVVFMVKGVISVIKKDNSVEKDPYIEEPAGIALEVVNNVYDKTGIYPTGGETIASGENRSTEDPEGTAEASDTMIILHHPNDPGSADPGSKGLIVVDAGHGGIDGGASSEYSDEKDITLKIAFFLKDELEYRGYSVYMTRDDDTFIEPIDRAKAANSKDGVLAFISIHLNSTDEGESINGVEVLTHDRAGCEELAQFLLNSVSSAVSAKKRDVVFKTNLTVTSKTVMPAALVECGFMSNPDEALLLDREDYQVKLALGMADALDQFIDSYY